MIFMAKRIAIINRDKCKPEKSNYACIRVCPPQRAGIKVFSKDEEGFPIIDETTCIGCGLCVKHCPFHAIIIVNLPRPIEADLVHRYGPNAFSLYRLPFPMEAQVVGLLGQNATGKTTSLKILSGLLKPNLGMYNTPPDWDEIVIRFRGTLLQEYLKKLADKKLKVVYKPQYIDLIPKVIKGTVLSILKERDEVGLADKIIYELGLTKVADRKIKNLSGGELQKLAIGVTIIKDADVYLFDEPSSYLDVSERMRIARIIRRLAEKNKKYVLVAEHDLAILDYISDKITIYYGEPEAYGIVSKPRSVREGINIFLDGYLPDENVRFRESSIRFNVMAPSSADVTKEILLNYPDMIKTLGNFKLRVTEGTIRKREIIGILGPNGIGKTTFIKLLAGILKPDPGYEINLEKEITISYKPQYLGEFIRDSGWLTVGEKLRSIRKNIFSDQWFITYVAKPLRINRIIDTPLDELSGGQLQKVAIACTLAKKADIYLLDEPSAYISAEDRFWVAKTIRSLTDVGEKSVLVVDHDLLIIDYISERLLVFDGNPGVYGHVKGPFDMRTGMNKFLEKLGVTFRRDKHSGRPRINKPGSVLDKKQKEMGEYYYIS